ncbi:phage head-tail connector protein [Sedimentibacter sp.]|uniref:phage head-tail connector protein n=1 Tax=Sedimentibacter sp. TaxID=1960295 RepID=UPI0028B0B725|nr:phage head-tail connector protein [Sedimentibacter sp.]
MALLDDIKKALRISNTVMDTEVSDLIDSAKAELKNVNVNIDKTVIVTEDQTPEPTEEVPNPEPMLVDVKVMDPLIKRAITLYCKANFGYDNPDAERFAESYKMLKIHLALSSDYQVVTKDV